MITPQEKLQAVMTSGVYVFPIDQASGAATLLDFKDNLSQITTPTDILEDPGSNATLKDITP